MTEQIKSHPKSFEVTKWFGPQTANVMLPDDAVNALVEMTDNIKIWNKTEPLKIEPEESAFDQFEDR